MNEDCSIRSQKPVARDLCQFKGSLQWWARGTSVAVFPLDPDCVLSSRPRKVLEPCQGE
jgi:hypothetical protein